MGADQDNACANRPAYLLLGDQSLDTHGFLVRFFGQEQHGELAKAFLRQAAYALKWEIQRLPAAEARRLPDFLTLKQLNERYNKSDYKHAAVDAALLTISQLAHFLDHVEKHSEDIPHPEHTVAVGLCSGLWAGAAISVTPSLPDLVPVGVQTVILAFKLGSYVQTIAQQFSHSAQDESESWTYLFPLLSHEETAVKLAEFQESTGIPPANRAYVSAVSSSGIAVSGPPVTLSTLVNRGILSTKPVAIPVHGPYHAPHLHAGADVKKILDLDNPRVEDAFYKSRPRLPVMSCSTGSFFSAADTKALMTSVASTILNETLMLDKVLASCVEHARQVEAKSCLILPLGPTQLAGALKHALKAKTDLEVVVRTPYDAPPEATSSLSGKCKLAIVGMAGRFPDAASHEKLWELLERGLDVHRLVPADRFDHRTHVDRSGKGTNKSHTPFGCWIEQPGLFDHRFFNMSPREALQTCPMQRMALTTAYEALEMSGYVPNRTPSTRLDRIGTFYGQTSDDWREINAAQDVDTYFITGGVRAFGPGRINYYFGFSGPSLNIDTACSSSAAAMQVACTALWARDCDTAIVGGLSCMTNPDIFAGLSKGQFLSKNGPCSTFDDAADGYCRGDGCASVVVKRLDDALADKDRILGVILGTATNHSADAISITHPHGPTQSALSTAILEEAGVDPLDVDYVEMHGTGTQAGDGTEMLSVTNVFAPADRKRRADRPLYLGAVKANVGHGEAASGVTALIKVLLMLEKNVIPPHVGIKPGSVMNRTFPDDLSARNVNIAFHATPFRRKDGRPRRVFINNFSAAGGNTGLLLEDGPKPKPAAVDPRGHHIVTVTGKSKTSMIKNAQRLMDWIETHPDVPLSHVAYTMTARKIQHYWRMAVTGSDLAQVRNAIAARLQDHISPVPPQQPKVVLMFTGQGSHYAGLGKDLYEHQSVFRQSIDEFVRLAWIHGLPSFLPLIDGSEPDVAKLSPVVVQLGLVAFEMALGRLWVSWGVKPSLVVGHSLGEYAALEAAGVLSASDVIYLVGVRAQMLVDKCTPGTHSMLAVQGSKEDVRPVLGANAGGIEVACMNGPRETVLSGKADEISEASRTLSAAGLKCTELRVPFAFHSAQVDAILDDFEAVAQGISFRAPKLPIISPFLGKEIEGEPIDARYLREHARQPVNFLGALVSAQAAETIDHKTVWIEIGPHPVCANLVKGVFGAPTVAVPSLRRKEDCYKSISSTVATLHCEGVKIDFNEYHRDFQDSVRLLDLPSYAFDESNHWLQYTGDWCLTKHRVRDAANALHTRKLSTTSVQKIIAEEVKDDVATVEIESDLCQEQLRNAVSGHLVNGAPLCPSSLYGDMAMTVCEYAYKLLRPDAQRIGYNVAKLEVPKSLIFDETAKSHILRLKVTANAKLGHADLVFYTGEGPKRTEHANCKVYFGNLDEWQAEFDRVAYLIKSRIDALKQAEQQGIASKIGRGLAYKLFSALVDYAPRYRGMEEVILDSAACEATAKIRFQTTEQDGNFVFSPYHIDSVCHISGFIINGSDAIDSREQVFISHGWGSMRFTEIPKADKEYRSYIRMQPVQGSKMMAGDAYVFDGDRIIGVTAAPPRSGGGAALAPPRPAPTKPPSAEKAAPPKKKKETVTPANIGKVNQKLRSLVHSVMDIIAQEVHCSHDELADNIAFADLGVDSLMSLTVSGRLREELELNISSNAFVDYATIGEFKRYLAQFEKTARKMSISSHDSELMSTAESPEGETESRITTPIGDSEASSVKGDDSKEEVRNLVRKIIADEMAIEVDEIIAAPDLADLGMDSLMSLSILGRLREETGMDISPDLFVNNPSLSQVEHALGITAPKKAAARKQQQPKQQSATPPARKQPSEKPPEPEDRGESSQTRVHPRIGLEEPAPPKPPRPSELVDRFPHRRASSVLLSGVVRTASKHLFMVPDGSGSATSYTEMAEIGGDWAVWGLFSPFMRTPEEYNCGVYGMAAKFIEEIKRRQPKGPYSVSGWSAGGVIAYEIVYQLVQAGETVENLIIIDAPCPHTIEPLPQGLHAWFASIGLLGEGDDNRVPEWLLPHFAASITALSNYDALPLPKEKCPKVMAIWCEDGVCKNPEDPRPEPYPKGHALFLLDNRSDFGPNRWDELLDLEKMQFRHMPGNHFSMMHGALAKQLNGFVKDALGLQ
ncbi:190496d0-b581-4049-948e-f857bac8ae96 [Thermothielavioides terrestris]|uniref:190496d0-b581-4049-948e-f857bac8ae96 n=1 Tax=Thermothielavioides terrestris TaxID=2587410 RepID=A0A3S4ANR2_9PEZI|nr:190496d0-b581-4049-948e-f857bac8ae96 [Thermothielavioides terrestris]